MATRRVKSAPRTTYGRRPTPPRRIVLPGREALRPLWPLFVGLLIVISIWRVFYIGDIQVEGSNIIQKQHIVELADTILARHPFSRNLFTVWSARIDKNMVSSDQRMKSVEVKRLWPNRLLLVITERQPSLGWRSGNQQFVLDVDGTAIGYQDQLNLKLPTVTDSTNLPVKIGDRVVPTRFVSFCTGIILNMPKRTGLNITGMRVPDTTSEVYISTNKNFLIKFDTTRGLDEQLGDLKSVLDSLVRSSKTPAEYIDLRVPGKAYYK